MKKLFILYVVIILALLIRAELKTLPLLNAHGHFEDFQHPIQASVTTYDLSDRLSRSALSEYRGNAQRTGTEVVNIPYGPFRLLWKIDHLNIGIHGASKSSPAVTPEGFAIADDAGYLRYYSSEGRLLWQFYSGISSRGFHSTPAIDEDTIYAGDYSGYIFAINKSSGKLRWLTQAGMTIGSSPFLFQNRLYVGVELEGPNGFLLALDARTGQWIWTSELLGNHPHSSPALTTTASKILMGSNTGELLAFDPKNGATLWRYKSHGDIKCAPSIDSQRAYFTSWDQELHAVDILKGQKVWSFKMDGRAMTCPAISFKNSIVIASAEKHHYAVNSENGQKLWSIPVPEQDKLILSSPLIIHFKDRDTVVLTCGKHNVCVQDLHSGQVLQKINLGGALTSSPVYKNGKLYFNTLDAGIQIYQLYSTEED